MNKYNVTIMYYIKYENKREKNLLRSKDNKKSIVHFLLFVKIISLLKLN